MNHKIDRVLFYQKVMKYIEYEYSAKYCKMPKEQNSSARIFYLICEYHRDGYSIPFVAGQIVDLLKSKYENSY